MTAKPYNGWTNYETWVVKLWMDNDEGAVNHFVELAEESIKRDPDGDIRELAEQIKSEHEESIPELAGFAADLMNSAFSEVDWDAIAASLLDTAKENLETV